MYQFAKVIKCSFTKLNLHQPETSRINPVIFSIMKNRKIEKHVLLENEAPEGFNLSVVGLNKHKICA